MSEGANNRYTTRLIPYAEEVDKALGISLTPTQRLLLFPGTLLAELYTLLPVRTGIIYGLAGVPNSGKTTLATQLAVESAMLGKVKKIYMVHTESSEKQVRSIIGQILVAYRAYYRKLLKENIITKNIYNRLIVKLEEVKNTPIHQVTVVGIRGLLDELGVLYSYEEKYSKLEKSDKYVLRSIEYAMRGEGVKKKGNKYYEETNYALIIDSLSTLMRVVNSLPFFRARGSILSSIHSVLSYYASRNDALIITIMQAVPRFRMGDDRRGEDYSEYTITGGRDQLYMIKAGVLMSMYSDEGEELFNRRRMRSIRGAVDRDGARGYAGFLNPSGLYPEEYKLVKKGINESVNLRIDNVYLLAIEMAKQGIMDIDKYNEALNDKDWKRRTFAELMITLAKHSGIF